MIPYGLCRNARNKNPPCAFQSHKAATQKYGFRFRFFPSSTHLLRPVFGVDSWLVETVLAELFFQVG